MGKSSQARNDLTCSPHDWTKTNVFQTESELTRIFSNFGHLIRGKLHLRSRMLDCGRLFIIVRAPFVIYIKE